MLQPETNAAARTVREAGGSGAPPVASDAASPPSGLTETITDPRARAGDPWALSKLCSFLLLHFVTFSAQVASLVLFVHTRSWIYFACIFSAMFFSGLFCAWGAWASSSKSWPSFMPVKNKPFLAQLPLLVVLGFLQGLVVLFTLEDFKGRRDGNGDQQSDPREDASEQPSNLYHCKIVNGMFEGLLSLGLLVYAWWTLDFPTNHPINRSNMDYDEEVWALVILSLISLVSAGFSLYQLDFSISWSTSRRLTRSFGYRLVHCFFRMCEFFARTSSFLSFGIAMWCLEHVGKTMGNWQSPGWWWWCGIPVADFLITLVLVYLFGGAEETRLVRLLCSIPTFFCNLFEFVDSPYKKRAARQLSRALWTRNAVMQVILLLSFVFYYLALGNGPQNWFIPSDKEAFERMFGMTCMSVVLYWLLLIYIKVGDKDTAYDLHSASADGQEDAVRLAMSGLMENPAVGLDINYQDTDGNTPLMLAAERGHVGVCRVLLQEGARVSLRMPPDSRIVWKWFMRSVRERWTALHSAAYFGHLPVVKLLVGRATFPGADQTAWVKAIVQEVTAETQTQAFTDESGNTPLHLAAWRQHEEVAKVISIACPHWRTQRNNKGQQPADTTSNPSVINAVQNPVLSEREGGSQAALELGGVPLLNQDADVDPALHQASEGSWAQQQLQIHRLGGRLRAPGLCSYIAGSCGGALGKIFLIIEKPAATPVAGQTALFDSSTANAGEDADVNVTNLEPIDSQNLPLDSWRAFVGTGIKIGAQIRAVENVCPEAVLGKGGYGMVWRAVDRTTGVKYAVKNVNTRRGNTNVATRECTLADHVRLKPHPFLVRLHCVHNFVDQDLYLLVMEFCPNSDLLVRAKQARDDSPAGTYKPPPLSLLWIGCIFLGLEHMHRRMRTLLRDLKPENVVLSANDTVKLTDLGLGRMGVESQGEWTWGFPTGSPGYIAPELLLQEPYDHRCDLYSLGVLVWVLLTGGVLKWALPLPPMGTGGQNDYSIHVNDFQLLRNALDQPPKNGARKLEPAPAREFVSRLIHRQPQNRMEHEDIRNHPFLQSLQMPSFHDRREDVERWLDGQLRSMSTASM